MTPSFEDSWVYEQSVMLVSYLAALVGEDKLNCSINKKKIFTVEVEGKYNKKIQVLVHPDGVVSIPGLLERHKRLVNIPASMVVRFLVDKNWLKCLPSYTKTKNNEDFRKLLHDNINCTLPFATRAVDEIFSAEKFRRRKIQRGPAKGTGGKRGV